MALNISKDSRFAYAVHCVLLIHNLEPQEVCAVVVPGNKLKELYKETVDFKGTFEFRS